MKILVTNDDGVYADGLWALVDALNDVADIVVVAPDREQSAVGTSITLHHPLRFKEVSPRTKGIKTYSVEGTPADSVILALSLIVKDGVDLVIAGINEGMNLGNDVFVSGTVGAALQGNFYGKPSIAISTAVTDGKVRFDAAARTGRLLAKRALKHALHPGTLLNVNVPFISLNDIVGVELTRLGRRIYGDNIQIGNDGKRDYYWIRRGESLWKEEEGFDIGAIRQSKISITPLRGNLTNPGHRHPLENMCTDLGHELYPLEN